MVGEESGVQSQEAVEIVCENSSRRPGPAAWLLADSWSTYLSAQMHVRCRKTSGFSSCMTRGAIGMGNGRVTAKASKERFQSAVALLGTAASTETQPAS